MNEGDTIIKFGAHEGDTYDDVVHLDPAYCNWVLSIDNPLPLMINFRHYLEGLDEGGTIITFGAHEGDTYDDVVRMDPAYCLWVLSINNPSPPMINFQHYLEDLDLFRGVNFGADWEYNDDWHYDFAPVY